MLTGSSFDTGLSHPGGSGWTEADNDCTCSPGCSRPRTRRCARRTRRTPPGIGTPPGSLQQSYNGTADGLAPLLFESRAVTESSTFDIAAPTGGASGKTTFQFDRRADVASILDLEGQATFRFELVDVAANTGQELWLEELDDSDNDFLGRLNDGADHNGIPGIAFGKTYKIRLTTTFNCAILCVGLQETVANFDNLRLRVVDGSPRFGPPTVETLDATDINGTGPAGHQATLNGTVNAQGLPTTFIYRYSEDSTFATSTVLAANPAGDGFNGGQLAEAVSRPRTTPATLKVCTTYYFRIEAKSTASATPTLGATKSFSTDCAPLATTDDAAASATTAILSSRITPRARTPRTTTRSARA